MKQHVGDMIRGVGPFDAQQRDIRARTARYRAQVPVNARETEALAQAYDAVGLCLLRNPIDEPVDTFEARMRQDAIDAIETTYAFGLVRMRRRWENIREGTHE